MKRALIFLLSAIVFCAVASGGIASAPVQTGGSSTWPFEVDDTGGPDEFGYTWIDSDEPGGPAVNFIDISSYGTEVTGLGDDNYVGPFPIGFNFRYYWYDVNQFWVGSNGWMKFSTSGQLAQPMPTIPTATNPNDLLCPLAADLFFENPPYQGHAYYWSNNNDSLIVSWHDVPTWDQFAPHGLGSFTFQAILTVADSNITFQYGLQQGVVSNSSVVVGIENNTGTVGLQVMFGVQPTSNYAVLFEYPDSITYEVHDMAVTSVMNEGSYGMFKVTGSDVDIWCKINNAGNQDETDAIVTAEVTNNLGQVIWDVTTNLGAMVAGENREITFSTPFSATVAGTYKVYVEVDLTGDMNSSNDQKGSELGIINIPGELGYDDGLFDYAWGWAGGYGGMGVRYAPPGYPAEITEVSFYFSGTTMVPHDLKILDDDGVNGAPGTEFYTEAITPTATSAWLYYDIDPAVEITEGDFYLALIQNGTSSSFALDTTNIDPPSRQTWEFTGVWAPFRNQLTDEYMIRCDIDWATVVHDIGVDAVMNEGSTGLFVISESAVDIWCRIRNAGNQVETECTVYAEVLNLDNQVQWSDSIDIGTISVGEEREITFSAPWTADSTGVYRVDIAIDLTGDMNPDNDYHHCEVSIIDLPGELYYDDATYEYAWGWPGGDGGMGVKMTPPGYPVVITEISFFYTGSLGVSHDLQILADDGMNGSPGTVLYTEAITPTIAMGWNYYSIDPSVEIIDNGFYLALIQNSVSNSFAMDTTGNDPQSRQTWEYTGVWAPYQNAATYEYMIRCDMDWRPEVHDIGVDAVMNDGSTGMFVISGSDIDIWCRILNAGNQDETECTVFAEVLDLVNQVQWSDSLDIGTIIAGEEREITFTTPWTADPEGTYRVKIDADLIGDMNPDNDILDCELGVVSIPTELYYDDGSMEQSYGWGSGNRGMGVRFIPPTYPIQIDSVYFYYPDEPSMSLDLKIIDDDGGNGYPGTTLYFETVDPTTLNGWNVFIIDPPVMIDEGAFFLGLIQTTSGFPFALDTLGTDPESRQTWQYIDAWAPFLEQSTQEFMIGCIVAEWVNVDPADLIVKTYYLLENYPNPFNPATIIRYSLPMPSKVTLKIFDVTGRLVNTLINREMPQGLHRISWDGTDMNGNQVSSGIYFYQMDTPHHRKIAKMVLIK